jgi:subtilisin-like proprotein convertase family protein
MPKTFNDPLFSSQWYLKNTGQRGGSSRLDINVSSAWDRFTGLGVIVAINDDGMDLTHPALAANILTNLVFDGRRGTTGQGLVGSDNQHGTVVGSIVGMAGNDGIGGVGVAYEAKLVPSLLLGNGISLSSVFLANLAAGAGVSINSWGISGAFAYNFMDGVATDRNKEFSAALVRAATEARGGRGMVIVTAGGNDRGVNDDSALNNFSNNKLTIAVGAVTEMGLVADYSNRGANLLITAPGGVYSADQSVNTGFGIVSADVQGAAGYNATQGTAGDYSYMNTGTSYSNPMVGGAAALMLQANPNLGFRDVANILAMTAVQVDATNASWVRNGATDWNLGSMHFSRDYGFGLLDVSAAVRLAESWSTPAGTMANWQSVVGISTNRAGVITDNNPQGLTVQTNLANNIRIERMEFDLWLDATSPSQLSATITSPNGTTVTLFDRPLTRPLVADANGIDIPDMTKAESAWPYIFTIGSTAFLGESSAGTWTLKLIDHVAGTEATYQSLAIRAWGSAISNDSQYIFTNTYNALLNNRTLNDGSGIDTINAAAVDTAVSIYLTSGMESSIGAGKFTIASTSTIENAIGGLGSDILNGGSIRNQLRGNGGNDSINGGAGIDTAVYAGTAASYSLTLGTASSTIMDRTANRDGTDTLTNVERLKFSDTNVALDTDRGENAGKAYRIYKAAFNRTPDAEGLGFWIKSLDNGNSLNNVSQGFIGSPEFQRIYGANSSDTTFLTNIYSNVLGRNYDQSGYDFWLNGLKNGLQRDSLLSQFSESVENSANVAPLIGQGISYKEWVG